MHSRSVDGCLGVSALQKQHAGVSNLFPLSQHPPLSLPHNDTGFKNENILALLPVLLVHEVCLLAMKRGVISAL